MKLFSWVQNKLINGRQGSNKTNIYPPIKNQSLQFGGNEKEEFSDWPNGFLSIGTLGNKDLKQESKDQNNINSNSNVQSQNPTKDLTLEEVKELQKELSAFISSSNHHHHHKSLDRTLSSLEAEKDDDDQEHFTSTTMVHNNNKAKDVNYLEYNGNAISKKSLSFLLKKMFVCGGGLGPTPSLRDPILSPPTTRMEKIFRAILQKKIHPQSPRKTMSKKIYLENRHSTVSNNNNDDDDDDDQDSDDDGSDDGSKWVKTDTEYIVLEI